MFNIESGSKLAIYEQIYDNFVKIITKGSLKAGDKMPSVRELAMQLRINPNTIQKAYKKLLEDGYIFSKPGSGNYVSEKEVYSKDYLDEIKNDLKNAIDTLRVLGVPKEKLTELVDCYYEEGKDD